MDSVKKVLLAFISLLILAQFGTAELPHTSVNKSDGFLIKKWSTESGIPQNTVTSIVHGIAKLFIGYTFTDAVAGYLSGDRRVTLLSRHRINSSLVFEKHENFKTGVEFYYGSRQVLDDRSLTRALAEVGLFGEKTFGKFSIFINAENLTDVRQGKYGPVVFPPHQNPTFAELYTHTEGRVFNGGIKIRF